MQHRDPLATPPPPNIDLWRVGGHMPPILAVEHGSISNIDQHSLKMLYTMGGHRGGPPNFIMRGKTLRVCVRKHRILVLTSDFIVGIRILSIKSVGSNGYRTRDLSHTMRRLRPVSHGVYRDLTYLSWYLRGFSIHYIYITCN